MQRFFVEPHQIDEVAHQIHIIGTDVNHISNVLRMKQGEEVWISDGGQKEYRCAIEAFSADEVLLHIIYAQEPDYELPSRIYLFQGLPKADKMELIIQKAVELGAESMDIRLIPYELAKGMQETKEILAAIEQGQSIGIFIGPEGGFEEKEVEAAISEGAKPITLGKRILRTETAGLAILSVLMFQLEN